MLFCLCLQEGTTTIGNEDAPLKSDIVLNGPGIAAEHCVIKYTDNNVYLLPHSQAYCSVNGLDVTEPTRLTQGIYHIDVTHLFGLGVSAIINL